jgi:hypothetical protein
VSRDCDRKNSSRGPVEYVLSSHQSLWPCLCQKLGYCDAMQQLGEVTAVAPRLA